MGMTMSSGEHSYSRITAIIQLRDDFGAVIQINW